MTDVPASPKEAKEPARPEPNNWLGELVRNAPKFTAMWGNYRAFVAVVTLAALCILPLVRDGAVISLTVLVLAAIWSPLVAKKLGLLD